MKLNVPKIHLIMANELLTQTEVAQYGGTLQPTVARALRVGRCTPKTAGKIAKGLGVSVEEILEEENNG